MTRRVAAAVLTEPTWTPPGIDPRAWRIALAEDLLDVLALMAEVEPAIVAPPSAAWLRSEVGWPGLPWYPAQSARLPDLLRAVADQPAPHAGSMPQGGGHSVPGGGVGLGGEGVGLGDGVGLGGRVGLGDGVGLSGDGVGLGGDVGFEPAPGIEFVPDTAEYSPTGPFEQVALIAADAPDLPGLVIAKLLRPLTTRPVAVAPAVDGPGLLGLATRLPAPDWLPDADLDALDVLTIRKAAPNLTDVVSTAGWHRLRRPEVLAGLDPRLEGWDATRALLDV